MQQATIFETHPYRVHLVPTGGLWNENCYLVEHVAARELAIVDPGDSPDKIIAEVEAIGARPVCVLLTHAHHDHVIGAAPVCEKFLLPCSVQRGDGRLLRHGPMYGLRFGGRLFPIPTQIQPFDEIPPVTFGGLPITTIHCPGHTAGGVCYRFSSAVITGDTLLKRRVGRTDLPGGDAALLRASISALLEQLPADCRLLPGHGSSWLVEEARVWWSESADALPQHELKSHTL